MWGEAYKRKMDKVKFLVLDHHFSLVQLQIATKYFKVIVQGFIVS